MLKLAHNTGLGQEIIPGFVWTARLQGFYSDVDVGARIWWQLQLASADVTKLSATWGIVIFEISFSFDELRYGVCNVAK